MSYFLPIDLHFDRWLALSHSICHPLSLHALFTLSSRSLLALFTLVSRSLHARFTLSSRSLFSLSCIFTLVMWPVYWSERKSRPHIDRSDIIVFVVLLDAASSQYAKILYFRPPSKIVKLLRSNFFCQLWRRAKGAFVARLSRDPQKAHLRCISCHLTQVPCQSAHAKR